MFCGEDGWIIPQVGKKVFNMRRPMQSRGKKGDLSNVSASDMIKERNAEKAMEFSTLAFSTFFSPKKARLWKNNTDRECILYTNGRLSTP